MSIETLLVQIQNAFTRYYLYVVLYLYLKSLKKTYISDKNNSITIQVLINIKTLFDIMHTKKKELIYFNCVFWR